MIWAITAAAAALAAAAAARAAGSKRPVPLLVPVRTRRPRSR